MGSKITFDTKVDARVLGGNRINKVVAADMNEIKTSVNDLYDAGADWKPYSTAGRDLLTGVALGYRIYNTTNNRPEYWNGSEWLPFSAGVKDIHCGSSPNYPSALEGDVLQVTANGKIGGTSGKNVFVKDIVICLEANAGGTDASVGSKWRIVRDTPQLTQAQIDAISSPNTGLLVYNTDMNMFNYFNGVLWIALAATLFGTTDELYGQPEIEGTFYYDTYVGEMGWTDGTGRSPFTRVSTDCACVKTVKVSLTSAQILNSNTTPIQLIAAPGAGKAILITNGLLKGNFVTTPYATNTNGVVRVGANPLFYQYMGFLINFTENIMSALFAADNTYIALASAENTPVTYITEDGDPTAGDGTIDLYLTYQIITL
jgi:hypothetical protein